MTRRGYWLFLALAVIWGVPYLLIKVAVAGLGPAWLVFLRTAIGAALLLPFALRRGRLGELLPRWRGVVLFTLVEMVGPWFLLSHAEQRISSGLAGLLIAAVPFVGVVLSGLTGGGEVMGPRRLLGLALGVLGVAALVGFDVHAENLVAVGEVGLVVVGYAAGPLIVARRLSGLPGLELTAASLGLCALVYAPVVLLLGPPAAPGVPALAAAMALGVFCTALAFLLFFALIAEVGPLRGTLVTYLNPAVAVAAGVLVLGEPFTAATAAGFALILGGSFVATRARG